MITASEKRQIDREYFRIKPGIFFRDLLIPLAVFFIAFGVSVDTEGAVFFAGFITCVVALHRPGTLLHEISHLYNKKALRSFKLVWDLTVGALILMPSARFIKPHRIHHSMGVFATPKDPQYMLLRSDGKLAFIVLVLMPFIMPFFNLVLVVVSVFGRLDIESRIENYLERKGYIVGSSLPDEFRREITWLSRYYLVMFILYAAFFPDTLPLMYAVHVGGWWLTILRIPLEHGFVRHKSLSDRRDHIVDSFTFESPMAILLQPNNLRFHTAHHMYPGVPYHNLPALHEELKHTEPDYPSSMRSYLDMLRFTGPGQGGYDSEGLKE